jgi:hypothetical protein
MAIQKVKKNKVRKTAKKQRIHIVNNKMDIDSSVGLDKMDMDVESQREPVTIGLVHSNTCSHCLAMKPDWDSMKTRIQSDNSLKHVNFMEIERGDHNYDEQLSKINTDLVECAPIVVNGYPTMFCKRQQYVKQYGGGRSAEELTEWVKNAALKGQLGGGKQKHRKTLHKRSSHKLSSHKSMFSFLKFW